MALARGRSVDSGVLPEADAGGDDILLQLSMPYIAPTALLVVWNVARRFAVPMPQGVLLRAVLHQARSIHAAHREGEAIYSTIRFFILSTSGICQEMRHSMPLEMMNNAISGMSGESCYHYCSFRMILENACILHDDYDREDLTTTGREELAPADATRRRQ